MFPRKAFLPGRGLLTLCLVVLLSDLGRTGLSRVSADISLHTESAPDPADLDLESEWP